MSLHRKEELRLQRKPEGPPLLGERSHEGAAPEAEAVYRARNAGPSDAWVTVRVLGGRAVLEELYIGGKPVREFLREQIR